MALDQTTKKKRSSATATEVDTRAKADMTIFPRFEINASHKQGWVPLLEEYQEQLRTLWFTLTGGQPGTIPMTFEGWKYEITLHSLREPVADEATVGVQRNTDTRTERDVRIVLEPPTPAG